MPEPVSPEPVSPDFGTTEAGIDQLRSPEARSVALTEAAPPSHVDTTAALIAELVLATPGVIRLEPTLSTAGPRILIHQNATDGIRLIRRADTVEIDINVATHSTYQARSVARNIHNQVTAATNNPGRQPGTITVNVITIIETPTHLGAGEGMPGGAGE